MLSAVTNNSSIPRAALHEEQRDSFGRYSWSTYFARPTPNAQRPTLTHSSTFQKLRLRRPLHFGHPKVAAVPNLEPDPNLLSVPAFSIKRRSWHSPMLRMSNPDLVTANPVDAPFTLPSTPRFRVPIPSPNNGVLFNRGGHVFLLLATGTSPQTDFGVTPSLLLKTAFRLVLSPLV
ncbi:hypothetical protein MLD38_029355 [Melastoma candidum]|uniref:Uncharacterized protein n=1 Tax=Melastoma candidum TaxID=119954 RepID=A0ACB9N3Q3_9MYRT|nr:hypothetical protein MLD38_029355 [Melastoma candidum]